MSKRAVFAIETLAVGGAGYNSYDDVKFIRMSSLEHCSTLEDSIRLHAAISATYLLCNKLYADLGFDKLAERCFV